MRSVKSANKCQDANSRNNSIRSTHSMHTHQSPMHTRTTESHSNCAPLAYAPCPAVSDQEIHLCPKGTISCKKKQAHTPENVLINHALCMQSLNNFFLNLYKAAKLHHNFFIFFKLNEHLFQNLVMPKGLLMLIILCFKTVFHTLLCVHAHTCTKTALN